MRVLFRTFGCKANQYDTERMRQELEALGARSTSGAEEAQFCVVNTCTVTNQADADARRFIRRIRRENPGLGVVVAGCSSALDPQTYREMDGVVAVVEGHDPAEVARATIVGPEGTGCHPSEVGMARPSLVQLESRLRLDALDGEPVGGVLLRRLCPARAIEHPAHRESDRPRTMCRYAPRRQCTSSSTGCRLNPMPRSEPAIESRSLPAQGPRMRSRASACSFRSGCTRCRWI